LPRCPRMCPLHSYPRLDLLRTLPANGGWRNRDEGRGGVAMAAMVQCRNNTRPCGNKGFLRLRRGLGTGVSQTGPRAPARPVAGDADRSRSAAGAGLHGCEHGRCLPRCGSPRKSGAARQPPAENQPSRDRRGSASEYPSGPGSRLAPVTPSLARTTSGARWRTRFRQIRRRLRLPAWRYCNGRKLGPGSRWRDGHDQENQRNGRRCPSAAAQSSFRWRRTRPTAAGACGHHCATFSPTGKNLLTSRALPVCLQGST